LAFGCSAKDIVLAIIGKIGTAGGTGHVVEYAGDAIRALDMAGRMTVCNMSIEGGARAGMIAPDQTTFDYIARTPHGPKGEAMEQAPRWWRTLPSDRGRPLRPRGEAGRARDRAAGHLGHQPEDVLPITGAVPDPERRPDEARRAQLRRMLEYMGLTPASACKTCRWTWSSSAPAPTAASRTSAPPPPSPAAARWPTGVRAMVVPGSGLVKKQAEQEGSTASCARPASSGAKPGARCASA
jgi:3-isopropylmalate/(R)-2-methylmalate dehydratase large subunit